MLQPKIEIMPKHAECTCGAGGDSPKPKTKKTKSAARTAAGKRNPYMKFMAEFRKDSKNHGLKVTEMAKKGGAAWRALSDDKKASYK